MKATLSEETANIRIEGEVTGQIAIGHHIVQVIPIAGQSSTSRHRRSRSFSDGVPNRPITRMQTMCSWAPSCGGGESYE
jgi:hypothetical protein